MSPVRVFYFYAQEDRDLLQELDKHLSSLKHSGLIEIWYDAKIRPGESWRQEVYKQLESADIILLLISPDFIESGYPYGLEMQRALERHNLGEAHIIPVLLRPAMRENMPFGSIEALPNGGIPVTEWQHRDEAFSDIVKSIKKAVTAISISSLALATRQSSTINEVQQTETVIPKELTVPEKDKNTVPPTYKQVTAKEIARVLDERAQSNHRTSLLLGSRVGRLFRSEDFFGNLQLFSKRNFSLLSRSEQFAECFSILTSSQLSTGDIRLLLSSSLQNSVITTEDAALAELIKQRYFDEIITTNIDNALEEGLYTAGMKEHYDFELFFPGSNRRFLEEAMLMRISKVFGDFSSGIYNLQKYASNIIDDSHLKRSLQHTLSGDLLVIGIDPVWDKEILRLIPESTNSMIFVNEEHLAEHELISNLLQKRPTQYILASYDRFMKDLFYNLGEGKVLLSYQMTRDVLDQLTDLKKQIAILYDVIKDLQQQINQHSSQSE